MYLSIKIAKHTTKILKTRLMKLNLVLNKFLFFYSRVIIYGERNIKGINLVLIHGNNK